MRAVGRSRAGPRRRRDAALAGLVGLAVVLLGACTGEEDPAPTPTPTAAETTEPAPTGVQVGVVLPPTSDPSAADHLEAERELAGLEQDRVGDVAGVRVVVPDASEFVVDVAALLADQGADLVCVLGSDGARVVRNLAEWFPATRFCALAPPRESEPPNVELFDVAYEELGHVLGVTAATAAGEAPVGIVLGDDRDERDRRRAGARAALAASEVALDGVVTGASDAAELAEVADEAELVALLIDVADAGVATVLASATPVWIGPRGVPIDASAGPALVRWSLRADVIVGAAVDRLVDADGADVDGRLGFSEEVFDLTYGEPATDAVRAAGQDAADEFARGARDALDVRPPESPEPSPARAD